jgi:hypothetical protein
VADVRELVQVEQQAIPVDREGRGARGEDDDATTTVVVVAAAAAAVVEAESTEERAQAVYAHNFL